MGWHRTLVLVAPLMALGATPALADSLRCGGYVVSTGDLQARVLDACGEPQRAWQDGFIEQAVRRSDGYYPTPPAPRPYLPQPGYETEVRRIIPVYKWEYNLGSGRLLKILIFHGDTLVGIIDGARQ